MHPTVVLDVVGLTTDALAHAPALRAFAEGGRLRRLRPALPAVTCTVQASMLTGRPVREHGIVGNGWYDRTLAEIAFWKQSNHLVAGDKVWDAARARNPGFSSNVMFWWYNMYSSADSAVTPRPIYLADGRKLPEIYSEPPDLGDDLRAHLGPFPLFKFWGPGANIESTRWIASAAMRAHERLEPTLQLVYLPHLDYDFQRSGPTGPVAEAAIAAVDAEVGRLIEFYRARGVRIIVLSEYGIEHVDHPVAVNRVLRREGWLRVRDEGIGGEKLDAGASRAFAVADHQVAHVYVAAPEDLALVARRLTAVEGVARVLDAPGQAAAGLDHPRSGELVLVADRGAWFTHDYWLDDDRAPDFARTVDIHRKPGYDPRELFLDRRPRAPKLRIAAKLLARRLGFRALLDVVPLDPHLVRGSHGRVEQPDGEGPVLITETDFDASSAESIPCTAVRDVILEHLG